MRTVWKFSLYPDVRAQQIALPEGAELLHVTPMPNSTQGGIDLYALVNVMAATQHRTFYVAPTGGELPDHPVKHIGTVRILGGQYVAHVFVEPLPEPDVTTTLQAIVAEALEARDSSRGTFDEGSSHALSVRK